jgi:pimeloyl-ACP methyl ester carboxylesterase
VAQHVDDLLQLVDLPSVVVGHSWGAMLGLSFAARYPERVSKLVLVGCGTYDKVARARFRDNVSAGLDAYDAVPGPDEGVVPFDEVGHTETWQDVLRLQREAIEPQIFSRITARSLMVHGAQDPHPGAATRDLLRQYIPALEYLELEHCGHEPWRERHAAEPFVRALTEWLAKP